MGIVLLGLDGEMSDSELSKGAVLVQIGAAFSLEERFCSVIGWDEGTYYATDKGMSAHGISPATIASAPRADVVDASLCDWLVAGLARRNLGVDAKRLVPVGFNVGGFDLPFVAAYLPRSYALLSRRVVDLNAFLMAYDAQGRPYEGSTPKWSGWKRLGQADAERRLREAGVTEQRHDAGYDASEALCVLDFLLRA
jgi:hypothetical protein